MNLYGAEEFAHSGDCPGCAECEPSAAEAFFARVELGDAVNGDKFREATVHGRLTPDDESVSLSLNSIGFRCYTSLTPEKARELGRALIAAADAPPGES